MNRFLSVRISSRFGAAAAIGISFALGQSPDFITHKVMDTNGSGKLAMTYEMPKDWKAQDIVYWNYNIRVNPMSYSLDIMSPNAHQWVSFLSALSYGFSVFQNGGSTGRVPPQRPSDFLMDNFTQTHNGDPGNEMDREDTPIPFPYRPAAPNVITKAFHSVLKMQFTIGGNPMESDYSVDFYGYAQPAGPGGYVGNWILDGLTVYTAPVAEMDQVKQTGGKMLSTAKFDPEFFSRYKQVCQLLLEKTKQETAAIIASRARHIVVSGGGGGARAMDKDTFMMHEELKGLKSQLFSAAIGN